MTAQSHRNAPVHPGFRIEIDPVSARHQLRMSTGVVVVLALAILASVFAFRPERPVDVSAHHVTAKAVAAVSDAIRTPSTQS